MLHVACYCIFPVSQTVLHGQQFNFGKFLFFEHLLRSINGGLHFSWVGRQHDGHHSALAFLCPHLYWAQHIL